MDDVQTIIKEEKVIDSALRDESSYGKSSAGGDDSLDEYGLNVASFALREAHKVEQSENWQYRQQMNLKSGDTEVVNENDRKGTSWLNMIDLAGKQQKIDDAGDSDSFDDLRSLVSTVSGRSKFSQRFERLDMMR